MEKAKIKIKIFVSKGDKKMDEFSGLYRKMCEKAERLQYEWIPRKWGDACFERGDYRDGFADIVRQKGMSEEEMKKFKAKYVWLPRENDLKESRMLGASRPPKIRDFALEHYHNDFLKNKEKMKEIEDRFKDKVGDIWDVKALMFVMEYRFRSVWDFDKQEWIEIKK